MINVLTYYFKNIYFPLLLVHLGLQESQSQHCSFFYWIKAASREKLADPALENYFNAHADAVNALDFNADGNQLGLLSQCSSATVGKDGFLKVWNLKAQTRCYTYPDPKPAVYSVRFSADGRLIAYSSNNDIIFRTPTVKSKSRSFRAHQSTVRSIDFTNAINHQLASCANDKTIKIWQIDDVREQFFYSLRGHHNWVRCIRFSPDAKLLVSASDDCTVKIWDSLSRRCVHSFSDNESAVLWAEFHPQSFYIASGGIDKTVRIWDLRMLRLIQVFKEHFSPVTGVSFHPSGSYLASTSLDSTVKIYDLGEGRVTYTLHGHKAGVSCGQFDHRGDLLSTGDLSGKILMWKVNFTIQPSPSSVSPIRNSLADRIRGHPYQPTGLPVWTERHDRGTDEIERPKQNANCQTSPEHHERRRFVPSDDVAAAGTACQHCEQALQAIPKDLKKTLSDILQQLSLLTETVSLLEKRLSRNEKKVQEVLETTHRNGGKS
ncbi:POC1 centriolar -like protein A [Trichinella nelsoni]|uniref:POC1 centriolar-like protein A n=1 Tax=Trichinella nelsoni TaxID=6336 RepID=A0A0V0SNN9_9BILA|nr:POC1 centriolar -like protein A [Trichinella nelsoni]